MNLRTLVWREVRERPSSLLTSTLAIALGVAALVAIRHLTVFSQAQVGQQLEDLGANVLVLPKSTTLQDYYAADLSDATLPESHAASILLANLAGVERLSPKLCVPAQLGQSSITLTGILPQNEFQSKAAWQTASSFTNKHAGCKKAAHGPQTYDAAPTSLASRRTIDQLQDDECVMGFDVAQVTALREGDTVELLDHSFRILAVLPATGTVDDSRVFAHLHTVQRLSNSGEVVSAIEVMSCCEDAAGQLVPNLSELLPDAKVVTISQVVATQVGVNTLLDKLSLFVLAILGIVGGAGVANTIASNVRERRREIGTLMAIGASPRLVTRLFLAKAWLLGLVGAISGSVVGLIIAAIAGPRWVGVAIAPLPGLTVTAVLLALAVTTVAAYWPARSAAKLDPCCCFQEA
jgi:putative ABC transport system permease protein